MRTTDPPHRRFCRTHLLALVLALTLAAAPARAGGVLTHNKISNTSGGFTGTLLDGDNFGSSVAMIGDLDGDGVGELAVGAVGDDDGGPGRGAVWILFMQGDGTVRSHQKISESSGFGGVLGAVSQFGRSVAALGDFDGDGTPDIAVGANGDSGQGTTRGAIYFLFMTPTGTVKSYHKIADGEGGFDGALDNGDSFGWSIARLGDLDGNGVADLAVGAPGDDDGGGNNGAVWILFLNSAGWVVTSSKISATAGGFSDPLKDSSFGVSVAALGDIDGDGVDDLAVGANRDNGGSPTLKRGSAWIVKLARDGTVKSQEQLSDLIGGFFGPLYDYDRFGTSVIAPGDLDCDGTPDLIVGADSDNDGGGNAGAAWLIYLFPRGRVKEELKISNWSGNFSGQLDDSDLFGYSGAGMIDAGFDRGAVVAVGAIGDDDGGFNRGAVWLLYFDAARCVRDLAGTWNAGGATLTWRTLNTGASVTFAVLRSTDDSSAEVLLEDSVTRHKGRFEFVDGGAGLGHTYHYRVMAYEDNIMVHSAAVTVDAPALPNALRTPAPNPFVSSTEIEFQLETTANAQLAVYDASGRLVRVIVNERLDAGDYARTWDGRNQRGEPVASGLYFLRLRAGATMHTVKAVIAR